jgi:ABC-type multidrug transport system fused ATPase/permease subunit
LNRSDFKNVRQAAIWTLKLIWSTDRWLTIGILSITLFSGLFPAGLALIARGLINAITESLTTVTMDLQQILLLLFAGAMLAGLQASVSQANTLLGQLMRDKVSLSVTTEVLAHAADLDVSFFEDPELQDVMERAQQNIGNHVSNFLLQSLTVINSVVDTVGILVILFVIEPLVIFAFLPLLIPYSILQWRLARQRFQKEHSRSTKRRWTRYFTSLMTGRRHVPEVKVLDLSNLLSSRYRSLLQEFHEEDRKIYLHRFILGTVFAVLAIASYYLVFARVVFQALAESVTLGDVAVFGGGVTRLRANLERLVNGLTGTLEETLYVSNLSVFLELKPILRSGSRVLTESPKGEIRFQEVSFRYPGTKRDVLSNVSFRIQPGLTVALIGENGAGKTTLVKLIARLYDPSQGSIKLDGIDLRELKLSDLRRSIGFVFQDFVRFEATAGENIGYGDWRRMSDRAWITELAEKAQIQDLVEDMPDGIDTRLGRLFGEYDLSGGQWQKIAIARAFARNASLLILDEPTSNLDARAENRLFNQFRQLAAGRTTILISHRFSTVSMADIIYVLHEGRIVESGSHESLLKLNGQYASLYRLQRAQLEGIANP